MLKPAAMKTGKARSAQENGVDDDETVDGHGQEHDEGESFSSHHNHHQRKTCWWCYSSPEDVKRARKEARRLERERERKREKGKGEGTGATQEHKAEEPVSSGYFNLAQLLSPHQVVRTPL